MTIPISGSLFLHRVQAVRLAQFAPDNSNAVTITFKSADGYSDFKVTVFGLPDEAAKRLADALSSIATETVE